MSLYPGVKNHFLTVPLINQPEKPVYDLSGVLISESSGKTLISLL
jgi:hypothetical protein